MKDSANGKKIIWLTCSIFLFDGIATSGGRSSLDTLSMRFGNVACFPCLSLIMTTSKEGSMSLILLLNSTLTMKVNLWAIHCDISGGIEVGSYCFFKVSALFPISSTPFFSKNMNSRLCVSSAPLKQTLYLEHIETAVKGPFEDL